MIANRGQEQDDSLKEIIESASSEPMSVLENESYRYHRFMR